MSLLSEDVKVTHSSVPQACVPGPQLDLLRALVESELCCLPGACSCLLAVFKYVVCSSTFQLFPFSEDWFCLITLGVFLPYLSCSFPHEGVSCLWLCELDGPQS